MILGLDIGGTAVKLGLVTEAGEILERDSADVAFDGYRTPIPETTMRAAKAFVSRSGAKIRGVGISATGQIDDREGTVIGTNGKIPQYEGSCLKAAFAEAFGVPATALNDANAALLGECFAGRAKGRRDVVMLTLGTGVGGGVLSGGRLLRGRRGIAGELGHFTLYQDGEPCTCGKRGCLESYASTTALIRRAKEKTGQALNGREIFALAGRGDPAVLSVLDAWIGDIAAGVSGLVGVFFEASRMLATIS